MKSSKNYLLLLLAATTVGGAALAWRQYAELVELRAASMNRDERADMQKRVWDLEKLARELQAQLAAQRLGGDMESLLATTEEEQPAAERSRSGGRSGRGDPRGRGDSGQQQATALRELINKPEVQAMLSLQQKAAIEARYGALFKNLNLQPEQVEKLKSLLAERSTTIQDVMAAAREQGINPRENPEGFRKLVTDAQNEINNGIKSVIGDAGFAQLQTYEQTLPQRNLVNDLQQRLSYSGMPLTPAQAEQMVQILAANAPQRPMSPNTSDQRPGTPPTGFSSRGPGGPGGFGSPWLGRGEDIGRMIGGVLGGPGGPGPGGFGMIDSGGRGGGSATVTPAAVSQAQTILAPPQLAALQQIQQQQQAQQQLRQLVTETLAANQPQGSRGTPTTQTGSGASSGAAATPGATTGGVTSGRKRGGG